MSRILRSGEFEIAEYFSKLFGSQKTSEKKESISLGGEKKRDSIHIGDNEKKESIISTEDILSLNDLECYLKIGGSYPVTKIKFDIFNK